MLNFPVILKENFHFVASSRFQKLRVSSLSLRLSDHIFVLVFMNLRQPVMQLVWEWRRVAGRRTTDDTGSVDSWAPDVAQGVTSRSGALPLWMEDVRTDLIQQHWPVDSLTFQLTFGSIKREICKPGAD